MVLLFFLISFGASIIGAICGIGGGVIIKPVLDAFQVQSVSAISFLSGITVLSMSLYSVGKAKLSGDNAIRKNIATPLAVGAAVGGILGKAMFEQISGLFSNKEMIGGIQAACLLIITIGTLIYTLKKSSIKTKKYEHPLFCIITGIVLGLLSSFLGIGGGPINLVVLYYFFSMETKEAAQNSLYIILFSQITSFLKTLATGSIPEFELPFLVVMIFGGILGAIAGRSINRRIDSRVVDHLFILLMLIIICINLFNIYQFVI